MMFCVCTQNRVDQWSLMRVWWFDLVVFLVLLLGLGMEGTVGKYGLGVVFKGCWWLLNRNIDYFGIKCYIYDLLFKFWSNKIGFFG